jgi:uncharacterized membrane protein/cytochrome c-type biogenesis protein CcmH/NrfG
VKDAAPAPANNPAPANPRAEPADQRGGERRWQPEWVFLALALPFGSAFLILTPPFQVPDEEAHLRRAFEISEGRIIAQKRGERTGDELPPGVNALYDRFKSLKNHLEEKTSAAEIRDAAAISLASGERNFVVFSNSAIHPPLTYIPQALALFIARWFTSSVLVCLYVSRAFNLLTSSALTFLAIRHTPIGKWAFALMALTPMALTLDASLSPDATTNALSFLLVAHVLACAAGPETVIATPALVATAILAAAVGFAKQMYFLLPLCYLMIPPKRMGTPRRYVAGFAVVLGATLLAVLTWSLVVRQIWSPADPKMGMDPGQQLRLMGSRPGEFAKVLLQTAKNGRPNGTEVLGPRVEEYLGKLGWAELRLTNWVYVPQLILLVVACVRDFGPRSGLKNWQALVAGGVALLVALTIAVIMHLTWDKLGAEAIALHGRYFMPAGPLVGIVIGRLGFLIPANLRKPAPAFPAVAALMVGVLLTTSLGCVYDRYYVDTPKHASERAFIRGKVLLEEGGEANQTSERMERARADFEESLRLDPDNFASHQWLGLLLRESEPAAAAEHFRIARRLNPEDSVSAFELANILAGRLEFAEAISLYRDALRLTPGNANVTNAFNAALRKQKFLEENLPRLNAEFQTLVRGQILEKRDPGTAKEGLCLKPDRGRVPVSGEQQLLASLQFLWRCPPPSGDEIRVSDTPGRAPFYACSSSLLLSMRVLVFPPANCKLLTDQDVSWYYQVPLAELTEKEAEQERAYRARLGLRFPLTKLPD